MTAVPTAIRNQSRNVIIGKNRHVRVITNRTTFESLEPSAVSSYRSIVPPLDSRAISHGSDEHFLARPRRQRRNAPRANGDQTAVAVNVAREGSQRTSLATRAHFMFYNSALVPTRPVSRGKLEASMQISRLERILLRIAVLAAIVNTLWMLGLLRGPAVAT